MSKKHFVSDMMGITARLVDAGMSLDHAANLITFESRGKFSVQVEGDDLVLKKIYRDHKRAPVRLVDLTPRDFRNVCVWLNNDAWGAGIDLGLFAVSMGAG